MAEVAVKQDIKTVPMKYKSDRNQREAEELKRLEDERAGIVQEQEAAEQDEAETNALEPEEKTFKKRYGDLRRHAQQKEEQMRDKIRTLETQLSSAAKEAIQLPKTDEELSEWSKQYPDVAKMVETIATKKAQELDSSIEERLKLIAEREVAANRKNAEAELMRFHPDFDDIRNSQEFHDWVNIQPEWVQKALYENDNDARAASRAIDLYKVDMNINEKKAPKKDSAKDAAKSVSSRGSSNVAETKEQQGNQWRESQVAKMKGNEFSKYEAEITEAIQSGNFIYDMTGGAR